MKIIFLGDLHAGVRQASLPVCEFQLKFFEDELFPFMEDNKIDTIVQFGDIFDSRKNTTHAILHLWKLRFFDVLEQKKIKLITLLGNHDILSKNTLEINSPKLFLGSYSNITVIDSPRHITLGDVQFLFIPWICDDNREMILKMVKDSPALYCCGHLELPGFPMQKGQPAIGDLDIKDWNKFDNVYTGHYHTRSKENNVEYIGTPYEMTWADHDDQKGFMVFDCKKQKTKFVKTENRLFYRIEYDDKDVETENVTGLLNKYVKVVVVNKTDPLKYDTFLTNILAQSPLDLKILDIESDFDNIDFDEELDLEDTRTLMKNFIEQVDTDLDRVVLQNMLNVLYAESLEITV